MTAPCDCISSNNPQPHQEAQNRLVDSPWTEGRKVCLDECIADTILYLWEHGVVTGGCCCGHNYSPPSVILGDGGYEKEDVKRVFDLIKSSGDNREWEVSYWSVVTWRQKMEGRFEVINRA